MTTFFIYINHPCSMFFISKKTNKILFNETCMKLDPFDSFLSLIS